jgi:hypothetical protein
MNMHKKQPKILLNNMKMEGVYQKHASNKAE